MKSDPIIRFYEKTPFPNNLGMVDEMGRVFSRYDAETPKNILCVGCGTGEELLVLAKMFPTSSLHGIEPSRKSCALAREKGVAEQVWCMTLECATKELKPIYDLVVCQGVVHHLENPETGVRQLLSLLSKDGVLWLGVYHHARWEFPMSYENRLSDEAWVDFNENPRERTYSHEMLWQLVKIAGGSVSGYAHPLPMPFGRLWRVLYDALFLWRRQPMVFVAVVRQ